MLFSQKIIRALESKKVQFHLAQEDSLQSLGLLDSIFQEVAKLSKLELGEKLSGMAWPGARPTSEQDDQPFIIPFGHSWDNHQQARAWAKEVLTDVATFCADGSQISLGHDINVPVGVVQIGWFENHHVNSPQGSYCKDTLVEVLSPADLSGDESGFADLEVEWRRFRGELEQAKRFMLSQAGKKALAMVDGSLVISFISQLRPERQESYIQAVEQLLAVSKETQVPMVGFIDSSYATDLVSMLLNARSEPGRARISDAGFLSQHMKHWGDRSRIYECARDDNVLSFGKGKYYPEIHFTYLQTTTDHPPVRIEMPSWILESGQHEWVLDVLRADCVVGTGYPYTIETADAVAVLSAHDREQFIKIFQNFMKREKIPLRFSRKSISKRMRRE